MPLREFVFLVDDFAAYPLWVVVQALPWSLGDLGRPPYRWSFGRGHSEQWARSRCEWNRYRAPAWAIPDMVELDLIHDVPATSLLLLRDQIDHVVFHASEAR